MYIYIYQHIYIHVCVCIHIYMCVCVLSITQPHVKSWLPRPVSPPKKTQNAKMPGNQKKV